jgi:hypothetical protein
MWTRRGGKRFGRPAFPFSLWQEDAMKKKILTLLIAAVLIAAAIPLGADYRYSKAFLAAAIGVNAGVTKTNGSDFTSVEINVVSLPSQGALTVTFARAAGTASTVDVYFEVSTDGGSTWATFEGTTISVATNHAVISGTTVRSALLIDLGGISNIRLSKIVNNDGSNNVTAVNVSISF